MTCALVQVRIAGQPVLLCLGCKLAHLDGLSQLSTMCALAGAPLCSVGGLRCRQGAAGSWLRWRPLSSCVPACSSQLVQVMGGRVGGGCSRGPLPEAGSWLLYMWPHVDASCKALLLRRRALPAYGCLLAWLCSDWLLGLHGQLAQLRPRALAPPKVCQGLRLPGLQGLLCRCNEGRQLICCCQPAAGLHQSVAQLAKPQCLGDRSKKSEPNELYTEASSCLVCQLECVLSSSKLADPGRVDHKVHGWRTGEPAGVVCSAASSAGFLATSLSSVASDRLLPSWDALAAAGASVRSSSTRKLHIMWHSQG